MPMNRYTERRGGRGRGAARARVPAGPAGGPSATGARAVARAGTGAVR